MSNTPTQYHISSTWIFHQLYFLKYHPLCGAKSKIFWPNKYESFFITNINIWTCQIPHKRSIFDSNKFQKTQKFQMWNSALPRKCCSNVSPPGGVHVTYSCGCMKLSFPFQVNNSVMTNGGRAWVDLGLVTDACITIPETCGPDGGALALWVYIYDCHWSSSNEGLISSEKYLHTGFLIYCVDNHMGWGKWSSLWDAEAMRVGGTRT